MQLYPILNLVAGPATKFSTSSVAGNYFRLHVMLAVHGAASAAHFQIFEIFRPTSVSEETFVVRKRTHENGTRHFLAGLPCKL